MGGDVGIHIFGQCPYEKLVPWEWCQRPLMLSLITSESLARLIHGSPWINYAQNMDFDQGIGGEFLKLNVARPLDAKQDPGRVSRQALVPARNASLLWVMDGTLEPYQQLGRFGGRFLHYHSHSLAKYFKQGSSTIDNIGGLPSRAFKFILAWCLSHHPQMIQSLRDNKIPMKDLGLAYVKVWSFRSKPDAPQNLIK